MRYYRKRVSQKDIQRAYSKISGIGILGIFVILFSSLISMFAISSYVIDDNATGFVLSFIGVAIGIFLIIMGRNTAIKEEKQQILFEEKQREIAKQQELARLNKIARTSIEKVDRMTGREFEEFLKAVYINLGYEADLTKASGDFGADLIIKKDNYRAIIQAKCYTTHKVPISAIQEIIGAKNHYHIYNALVITNNFFTAPAQKLASENNIQLIDRENLINILYNNGLNANSVSLQIGEKNKEKTFYNNDLRTLEKKILEASNLFDIEKTRALLKEFYLYPVNTKEEYLTYHFTIANIVNVFYKLKTAKEDFSFDMLQLCKKDMEILIKIAPELKNSSMPTLTKTVILLEKQKQYDDVIKICDFAIKNNFNEERGITFALRKEKILQKLKEGV